MYCCVKLHCWKLEMTLYHSADASAESVSNTLTFVDIDTDSFTKYKLHGGRVAQLYNHFDYEINSLIGRCDTVQMYWVMHGWVPCYQCTHLTYTVHVTDITASVCLSHKLKPWIHFHNFNERCWILTKFCLTQWDLLQTNHPISVKSATDTASIGSHLKTRRPQPATFPVPVSVEAKLSFIDPGCRWAHSPSLSKAPGISYQGTMKTSVRMLTTSGGL